MVNVFLPVHRKLGAEHCWAVQVGKGFQQGAARLPHAGIPVCGCQEYRECLLAFLKSRLIFLDF